MPATAASAPALPLGCETAGTARSTAGAEAAREPAALEGAEAIDGADDETDSVDSPPAEPGALEERLPVDDDRDESPRLMEALSLADPPKALRSCRKLVRLISALDACTPPSSTENWPAPVIDPTTTSVTVTGLPALQLAWKSAS